MASALDSYRFPPNPPAVQPSLITAQPSQFGQVDEEGNNAYFNNLFAANFVSGSINGPAGAPNILPSSIQGKIGQATVAAQSIPNNAQTAANFSTGNYPNPDFFVAQGTTGIKCVKAGLILAIAYTNWASAAGGVQRITTMLANAGTVALNNGSPLSASFPATGNTSYLINVSANDVISLSLLQDSGGALNVNSSNLIVCYLGNLL